MALGAIYLWEPEVFTGKAPDLNQVGWAAYQLYQQHRHTNSAGKTLQAWIDAMAVIIHDARYADYFSASTQQWATAWQQALRDDPSAVIELEHFDLMAQGDALYRAFYLAVQQSGVGFFEPRFAIWGMGQLQCPPHAVEEVLSAFLPPFTTQEQQFDLANIQPPRNLKNAVQLTRQWAARHPYASNLKFHVFNVEHDFINTLGNITNPEQAPDDGYYCMLLTDESDSIFYQISLSMHSLTKAPMLNFIVDMTRRFIPVNLQEKLFRKLTFRLRSMDIRNSTSFSRGSYDLLFSVTGRWDDALYIQKFFRNFDGYLSFLLSHLGGGKLTELQAWAYGDMPEGVIIELQRDTELLLIALSLDATYLQQRYEHHKEVIAVKYANNPDLENQMMYLQKDYIFYQQLMQLVKEAGTALPAYQKG